MYSCNDGDIIYNNENMELGGFGTIGGYNIANVEEKQMYGVVLPADSKEFAEWEMSFGQNNAVLGYTISFVYAEEDASAVGTCLTNSFTKVTTSYKKTTNYNVQLTKGWNIVKYSIDELYEDKEGNLYPMVVSYNTLDNIPEDIEWHFIKD
jgi:hypothetical protein